MVETFELMTESEMRMLTAGLLIGVAVYFLIDVLWPTNPTPEPAIMPPPTEREMRARRAAERSFYVSRIAYLDSLDEE